jgi:hypothetical protein
MGSAGTGNSFVGNHGGFSSAAGRQRLRRVRERLVLTVAVGLFLAAFLAGCSGFFISPSLSSTYVSPAGATIATSNTVQLVAHGMYSDGSQNEISGDSVSWSSSDPTIASVTSPGGLVTGVAVGTATITAATTTTVPGSGCQVTVSASFQLQKVCSGASTQTLTATANVSVTE